jgi:uncharacterized membrane protein
VGEIAQMTRGAVKKAAKNTVGKDGSRLKDPKGLAAAGVGMAVLPFAVEQLAKRFAPKVSEVASDLGDQAKQTAKDAAKEKLSPGNLVKGLTGSGGGGGEGGGLLSSLKPGGSGSEGDEGGGLLSSLKPGGSDDSDDGDGEKGRAAPGYGSGRRMPIQQGVSVAVPIKTAYNAWTGFEDWPKFMHRLESAEQVEEAKVAFTAKIWGIRRRFEATISEQRPDQRIEWNVEEGLSHTGVVTFHQLAERLTRIELDLDLEPHGIIEKTARGMRFVKRAVRGDLHRFKAYVELYEDEIEEGWRGTIVDGEVKRKTDRPSRKSGSRSRSRASRNGSSSSSRGRSSSGSSRGRSSSSSSRGRSSSSSSRGRSSSSGSKRRTSSRSRSRS